MSEDQTKQEPRKVPTVQEFRDTTRKKHTLQNIIVGFVFASAMYAAFMSSMTAVPLTGMALWMAMHDM